MDAAGKRGIVNACAKSRGVTRRIELVDFAPLWEGRGDTCPVCRRLYGLGQLRASVDHIVPLSQRVNMRSQIFGLFARAVTKILGARAKTVLFIQCEQRTRLNRSENQSRIAHGG